MKAVKFSLIFKYFDGVMPVLTTLSTRDLCSNFGSSLNYRLYLTHYLGPSCAYGRHHLATTQHFYSELTGSFKILFNTLLQAALINQTQVTCDLKTTHFSCVKV